MRLLMRLEQLYQVLAESGQVAEPMRQVLQDIITLDKERITNLPKLRKQLTKLTTLLKQADPHVQQQSYDALEQYKQELAASEEHIRRHFGIDLDQALQSLGLPLTGTYPYLKAGLFMLQLNFEKDRVTIWYGNEQERLGECRLLPEEVAKRLEHLLQSLGSGIEAERFPRILQHAYQRTCTRINNPIGQRVPINAVLPEVAFLIQKDAFFHNPARENYRSYSRADFSYDLYRLRSALVASGLKLAVAVRAYTQRRQDFLWIPDNDQGQGTTYSHLQFEENTP